jgi:hypothetical protein
MREKRDKRDKPPGKHICLAGVRKNSGRRAEKRRPVSLIQVRTKLLDLPGDPLRENGRNSPSAMRCDRATLVVAMPVSLVPNCQRPLYQERALGCPAYAII